MLCVVCEQERAALPEQSFDDRSEVMIRFRDDGLRGRGGTGGIESEAETGAGAGAGAGVPTDDT